VAARTLPRRLVAVAAAVALVAALVALALEWTGPGGAGVVVGGASLGFLAPSGAALRGRLIAIRAPALAPVLALPQGVGGAASDGRELVKRVVDVAIAGVALVLAAPIFLLVALAVAISDGGPVLYTQWRVGRGGETFRMLKFRSMRVDAERAWTDRPNTKYRTDERVTALGRMLRRTSLDELPQLLHVLSGRMSIVGPRPLPIYEAPAVPDWATARWAVKPGLTCTWQVSGRSDLSWEERMRLDGAYADAWSVRSDLGLVLRTVRAVASGRGAY
jgi:lipopolysaccharide/colanic/teichoic acid biosynthesis glycosyltransferase